MSNKHYKENLLYLIIWVVLFLTPFISFALRMANDSNVEFNWQEIFFAWRLFVPFLIVFLNHNFWVAPLLVYKKRNTIYWATTACIMLAFAAYQCSNRPKEPGKEWAERRNHYLSWKTSLLTTAQPKANRWQESTTWLSLCPGRCRATWWTCR